MSDRRSLEYESERHVIFVPEIEAFGGGERVYLSLCCYLHDLCLPYLLVSYYQRIDLQAHCPWPVDTATLRPSRHPLQKLLALHRLLRVDTRCSARPPLLVGLQAAMHAAAINARDYSLLVLDTPSLLSAPKVPAGIYARALFAVRRAISHRLTVKGIAQARAVIITTESMAREFHELYGRAPTVCYQGITKPDQEAYKDGTLPRGRRIQFLSVCRLESNKRIEWILQALREIGCQQCEGDFPWALEVIGEGALLGELEDLAEQLGLAACVTFRGLVSDQQLSEAYERADIFLMPAVQGYGLPALEALIRKIPVVIHEDSGVSELLKNTPWVEIFGGGVAEFGRRISKMVDRVYSNQLSNIPTPRFPTDTEWAAAVVELCAWGDGRAQGPLPEDNGLPASDAGGIW